MELQLQRSAKILYFGGPIALGKKSQYGGRTFNYTLLFPPPPFQDFIELEKMTIARKDEYTNFLPRHQTELTNKQHVTLQKSGAIQMFWTIIPISSSQCEQHGLYMPAA